MNTRHISIIICLFFPYCVCGQAFFSGKITDAASGMGIAWATIAVKGAAMGTYADSSGHFALTLPNGYPADSLIISSVGYSPATVPCNVSMEKPLQIKLIPEVYSLEEVVISKMKKKLKTGSFKRKKNTTLYIPAGHQYAVFFRPGIHAVIEDISFYIAETPGADAKIQFHVYTCDTTSCLPYLRDGNTLEVLIFSHLPVPAKEILLQKIITEHLKKGWNTVSVAPYALVVPPEGFYVGLEVVDGKRILLQQTKEKENRNYARKIFDQTWNGGTQLGPVMNVTLLY